MHNTHHYWQELYEKLAGPDWPPCPLEVDFELLPDWVQQELCEFGYVPNDHSLKRWLTSADDPMHVFYLDEYNGGGTTTGTEYVKLIKERYSNRVFQKCYEWCSGPGFIGFDILSNKLCNQLCLSDIHDPALVCAEETALYPQNNCKDNVSIYLLKDLSLLPAHEQFDLIVSNPPHANGFHDEQTWFSNNNRISSDINWQAHKNFFANIKQHLLPDGIILLQENHAGSQVDDFLPFIEQAGLKLNDVFLSKDWYIENDPVHQIYYLEIIPA